MKYIKIFMLVLASCIFAACSDDDDNWNTVSDAVVSMGSSELSFKENKGMNTPIKVPVKVTGTRNGAIQVTVDVAEVGDNPAMDDIHYIITSKTIVIPADAEEGYIEMRTIDDSDINENRQFTMTIVDAKGAIIDETASTTLFTLKDNDSEFYEKLMGSWVMTSTSMYGGDYSWNVSIEGYEEGEEGYNQTLFLYGFDAQSNPVELEYHFDAATKEGYIAILPTIYAAYYFGVIGQHFVATYGYDPESKSYTEDLVKGTWNDDFTEITFAELPYLGMRLFTYPDASPTDYTYGVIYNIKLTKKK